ncbi:O-antigen ligase family protein, partial [Streptococcus uberis]|uniref:O-antigen ligase family protein n=1 Tax=Streptococcus uberis TaxID=1349 RepID=UPI002EBC7DE8|nr:O-antigen ligase family protein [Streptococcus uberis]
FLYKLINSKFEKNIVISLTLITVFMTRSNSGMIILITMLLMLIVTEKENKYLKLLFVISSFILVLFIGTQFIPGYFDRFTNTISSIFGSEQLMKQDAFNGRTSIFKISFQIFGDNLFIGKGFNYRILIPNQLMTHNWVLESLVTGGIMAFIIKIFILLSLLKKVKSLRMKYIKLALLISLLFTHVQGLVEPSFGSPIFELFFWMIFGFSISCSYNFHDVQMKGTQNEN